MEMSVVNVTSRQAAPFQALVNMIKIIYMNKPEVFKTLITVLCDYDQNNSDCIVKTIRYIHILLSCNPDLADYLISFLPEPTPTSSHLKDKPSGLQVATDCATKDLKRSAESRHHISSPIKQKKYTFHPTKSSPSVKASHESTNYSVTSTCEKDFLKRTPTPELSNTKPVSQTKYKFRPIKTTPSVKESQLSTSYSITTTSSEVKNITTTQVGFNQVSPHLRPLMVPQPGGAANHIHVTKSESETSTVDAVLHGLHSPAFPQPLAPTNLSYHAGGLSAEPNPPKREKMSFDSSFDQERVIHPLLESSRPICSIKQELGTYDQCTFLSPSTAMPGIGQITPVSHNTALGVSPKLSESYQTAHWTSSVDKFGQHIPHASPGIHLQMQLTTPYQVNQHLGLRLPLNKLVYEAPRQIYTNPDLSHLLTMTRPTSTTVLHPNQAFKQPIQESKTVSTSTQSFQSQHGVGKQMDSLKELTTKLKIAETTMKLKMVEQKLKLKMVEQTINQKQLARLQSLSKGQGSVRYKISSVPLQFSDSVPTTSDPNTVKHMKSFPYVQRLVLADGGISTFKIDENAESTEAKVLPKPHKAAKHHLLKCKHKRKKHRRERQKVEETLSQNEEKKNSSEN